jgi:hypothetical protein
MADVTVKVITKATNYALLTLDEAKVMLQIASGDVSKDAYLQMLIDQNSDTIATMCNRTFAYEEVLETWRCVGPVCCPDGSCRIYLTHYPVKEDEILSVESPVGALLDVSTYEIEEASGKLTIFSSTGCESEIVVHYWGGYNLPDDAPDALKQAASIAVRTSQTEAEQATVAGVRMIAHKDSRIMYHSPSQMQSKSSGGGSAGTAQQTAVKNLLFHYTRMWV